VIVVENRLAFLLGIISGALLIISGSTGGLGLWALLPWLVGVLGLPAEVAAVVNLVMTALLFVAGLGGLSVILGSILFAWGRVRLGRLLVGLGAGVGIISLVLSLLQMYLSGILNVTLMLALAQTPGWAGAVLSIVARFLAKEK